MPIGGVIFFLISVVLKLPVSDNEERRAPLSEKFSCLDLPGGVLIIGAVCCLLLALQWGGTMLPWRSAKIIGLFVGFGLLIIAFGLVQWLSKEKATIPLRLLRQRSVIMGAWFLFFLEMSIYGCAIRPTNYRDLANRCCRISITFPSIFKRYKAYL